MREEKIKEIYEECKKTLFSTRGSLLERLVDSNRNIFGIVGKESFRNRLHETVKEMLFDKDVKSYFLDYLGENGIIEKYNISEQSEKDEVVNKVLTLEYEDNVKTINNIVDRIEDGY